MYGYDQESDPLDIEGEFDVNKLVRKELLRDNSYI